MAERKETKKADEEKHEDTLTESEIEAIEDHAPIRPVAIFESIRREGRMELHRPNVSLLLSGYVAGLALGLSVLSEALLRTHLPEAEWRPLVENFGYSFGFLIVILGQMQLFTENTIKAVCPVLDAPSSDMLARLMRLWTLVLVSNLAGAATFGAVLWFTRSYQPEVWEAMRDISLHAMDPGWGETMMRGVGAGWLVAALVWMMPNAGDGRALVIVGMTYLIALADFAHVVAGTTEASLLVFSGDLGLPSALGGFVLPALIGNLLGGTVFFTILAWGQIRTELAGEGDPLMQPFRNE